MNVRLCASCNTELIKPDQKKYCSRSCAAKENNKGVTRNGTARGLCKNCDIPLTGKSGISFCSNSCANQAKIKRSSIKAEEGLVTSPSILRRIIRERDGSSCNICQKLLWEGQEIPLVLDHTDGNSSNNTLGNLRLICPNCDALLPTYKNRNKGNGRHSRMERYYAGKSY